MPSMPNAGLQLVTSTRLEDLAACLVAIRDADPLPPLRCETVVVPSRGMASWLGVRLARAEGLLASTEFPFPLRWAGDLVGRLGIEGAPGPEEADPFGAEVLVWRIHALLAGLDAVGADDRVILQPLERYLDAEEREGRALELARRLSAVFVRYQVHRPFALRRWERGESFEEQAEHPHEAWQAWLWRRLRAEAPDRLPLSERLLAALEALDAGARDPGGDDRLVVFGLNALPPLLMHLIAAVSRQREVHVLALVPTQEYWVDLVDERRQLREQARAVRASAIDPAPLPEVEIAHPLLASMGRASREFQWLWTGNDVFVAAHRALEPSVPRVDDSLLHRLQSDLEAAVDPRVRAPSSFDRSDRSIRVHRCHGEMREMEVLRDEVLRALEDGAAHEPGDVLVLVPDLDRYAPVARAVLGRALPTRDGRRRLPVRIADRRAAERQPFARLLLRWLELVDGRRGVVELLDLLEIEPFARRYGLQLADLPLLRDRVRRAGIVWGSDPQQRARRFQLPPLDGGSWREGMRRLLLGIVTGPGADPIDGELPVADVTTSAATTVARFLEAMQDTLGLLDRLEDAAGLKECVQQLRAGLLAVTEPAGQNDWEQRAEVVAALERMETAAERFDLRAPVAPVVLATELAAQLDEASAGRGFVSGGVTVAELRPMRSLPYRVIAVAGLDADSFPRRDPPPGFDLVAARPRPGDRSLREDDRQLFLELLLSARERLILSFVAWTAHEGKPRARSVCLDELLDTLDRSAEFVDGDRRRPASEAVVVDHRLHPFDTAYGNPAVEELFTYDARFVEAAAAGREAGPGGEAVDRFVATAAVDEDPAPEESLESVEIGELERFWKDPCAWFCRERLGLRLFDEEVENEEETFALDRLQTWRLRQSLIDDALDVRTASVAAQALGLGSVPSVRQRVAMEVEAHSYWWQRMCAECEGIEAIELDLAFPELHLRVSGTIECARRPAAAGEAALPGVILRTASKEKPAVMAQLWLRHLLLSIHTPAARATLASARKIVPGPYYEPVDAARERLRPWLEGFLQGRRHPLPYYPRASHQWAKDVAEKREPDRHKLREAFFGNERDVGDLASEAVVLCTRGMDEDELFGQGFQSWAERLWVSALHARKAR